MIHGQKNKLITRFRQILSANLSKELQREFRLYKQHPPPPTKWKFSNTKNMFRVLEKSLKYRWYVHRWYHKIHIDYLYLSDTYHRRYVQHSRGLPLPFSTHYKSFYLSGTCCTTTGAAPPPATTTVVFVWDVEWCMGGAYPCCGGG